MVIQEKLIVYLLKSYKDSLPAPPRAYFIGQKDTTQRKQTLLENMASFLGILREDNWKEDKIVQYVIPNGNFTVEICADDINWYGYKFIPITISSKALEETVGIPGFKVSSYIFMSDFLNLLNKVKNINNLTLPGTYCIADSGSTGRVIPRCLLGHFSSVVLEDSKNSLYRAAVSAGNAKCVDRMTSKWKPGCSYITRKGEEFLYLGNIGEFLSTQTFGNVNSRLREFYLDLNFESDPKKLRYFIPRSFCVSGGKLLLNLNSSTGGVQIRDRIEKIKDSYTMDDFLMALFDPSRDIEGIKCSDVLINLPQSVITGVREKEYFKVDSDNLDNIVKAVARDYFYGHSVDRVPELISSNYRSNVWVLLSVLGSEIFKNSEYRPYLLAGDRASTIWSIRKDCTYVYACKEKKISTTQRAKDYIKIIEGGKSTDSVTGPFSYRYIPLALEEVGSEFDLMKYTAEERQNLINDLKQIFNVV
jgi:hypothetical protein